eukprot:TRINITY_DN9710_c0_g1_i3.p2 TRINITY_DN9710_c0_g1~~TRINITY_DN9710_c0_g1_i3.p2  ORF type:complete len:280 (-),score=58.30 TRINITY_DN9710_c0_g1_i3:60-899(-)
MSLSFRIVTLVGLLACCWALPLGPWGSRWSREADTPAWTVLAKTFSAVTIGIAFKDDKTGWTSHTDGSSGIQIVKTTDGGQNWAPVANNTGVHVMTMGVAAKKGAGLLTNVATTGLASSEYSLDGDTFKTSIAPVVVAQDIEYKAGRMSIAGPNGPCTSSTGGLLYACHKIAFKNPGTGRYVSSPSKDVIYVTAGTWPDKENNTETLVHVSRNVRVAISEDGVSRKFELGHRPSNANGSYTAEIWKSTNGGKDFTSCLLYTSDAADEEDSVDLGGRRII